MSNTTPQRFPGISIVLTGVALCASGPACTRSSSPAAAPRESAPTSTRAAAPVGPAGAAPSSAVFPAAADDPNVAGPLAQHAGAAPSGGHQGHGGALARESANAAPALAERTTRAGSARALPSPTTDGLAAPEAPARTRFRAPIAAPPAVVANVPSAMPPPPARSPVRDERAAEAQPAIDANGRFATTYRPGAGHLSAFEAALHTGAVPASSRELVGDLGARYAPAIEPPAHGALAFRVDLERSAMAPSGGALRMRLALRSGTTPATARPPMSVHLVLDASGSMSGAAIENARAAARTLVERLAAGDTFSLTRFSTDAQVLIEAGPVGSRRERIVQAINGIQADGGTNISEGLRLGYAQAARGPQSPETVKLVMLLSDGRANAGTVEPAAIASMASAAFQDAVQTSAFGVGTDYDGPLMASIADQGAGGYYYLPDSARIAAALTTELDARVQPVAQAVEVRVRLRPDVQLTQTYGSRRLSEAESAQVRAQEVAVDTQVARRDRIATDRANDIQGGMRFFIPGFARDDRHVILLGLRMPAGSGERAVATVELRYKDRLTGRNVVLEQPVRVRYADSDTASVATVDPSVARTVQGFDAGETLVAAARAVERGERERAVALLTEREAVLRAGAASLAEPRLADDAARVARFRELARGTGAELSDTLVLALLMDTSARGYMH